MFRNIIKLSSTATVKAAARNFSSTEAAAAAASPISAVLYPKINNKVVAIKAAESPRIRNFSSTAAAAAAARSPISAVLYPIRNFSSTAAANPVSTKKSAVSPKIAVGAQDEISLRPFQLTDLDDIMEWGTDEKLSRYCRWKTVTLLPKDAYYGWEFVKENSFLLHHEYYDFHGWYLEIYRSKEDALEDIKNNIIPHPWFRAICLKNNNRRPIGKIFIHPSRPNDPYIAEIGCVVASEHWGKGIATTAVKMTLDSVFKEWPHLHALQALVHLENLGGQRVLEKAGFTKVGVFSHFGHDKEGRTVAIARFTFMREDI